MDEAPRTIRLQLAPAPESRLAAPQLVNKIVLRRHADAFMIEGYFLDPTEIAHRASQTHGASELNLELPTVFRVAITGTALLELIQVAGPFWDQSVQALESEAKNAGEDTSG